MGVFSPAETGGAARKAQGRGPFEFRGRTGLPVPTANLPKAWPNFIRRIPAPFMRMGKRCERLKISGKILSEIVQPFFLVFVFANRLL
ncbi:MAG: hypothetical protein C6W56_14045 [Caldibacillus debilis]|nr:hypothetical protein [Bacillaceae bacterium]REJ24892.1 MAG: hypothetical protein C6W56_14045 [Caldibacillus debilis]